MTLASAIREVVGAVALAGLLGSLFAAGTLAGPAAVGQVVALSGAAQAAAPGGEPRTLSCNDTLYEGETVITSEGARVGILSHDVYAQLDVSTRLGLGSYRNAPDLHLSSGAVRIVDTRIAAQVQNFTIATPHLAASGLGSDTEVWVVSAAGDHHTRLCTRERPIRISAAGQVSTLAGSGDCALVTESGVSASEAAPKPSIGLADLGACSLELGDVAARFTPTDVAAPPIGLLDFPSVLAGDTSPRDPCDDPGSGCSAGFPVSPEPRSPRLPPVFVDPDPDIGGCPPGAICNGPDIGLE